jgi:hypothetical protein
MMKSMLSSSKISLLLLAILAWGCGQGTDPSTNGNSNPNGKTDDGKQTATASKTDFVCTTLTPEDGQTATIQFTVINLLGAINAKGDVELVWPESEEESPIKVEPETSSATPLTSGIVDGYIAYADGQLTIFSDDIGCDFGNLVLYQDNNFEHGYFRLEQHCSEDNSGFYTIVSCELNPPIK